MESFYTHLTSHGWCLIKSEQPRTQEELLSLAFKLGKPVASRAGSALIDELKPTSKNEAKPKSLSAIYGKDSFPLHTDPAYWKIPARYILLHAKRVDETCTPTLILDSQKLICEGDTVDLLKGGVFKVVNGGKAFLM